MRAEDVRRWVAGRRAAEAREREEARERHASPAASMAAALALIALAARLQGWPLPEDEASREEDLRAYQAWARLRTTLRDRAPAG